MVVRRQSVANLRTPTSVLRVLKGDAHRGHPVVPVSEGRVNIEMQMGTSRVTSVAGESDDSTSWNVLPFGNEDLGHLKVTVGSDTSVQMADYYQVALSARPGWVRNAVHRVGTLRAVDEDDATGTCCSNFPTFGAYGIRKVIRVRLSLSVLRVVAIRLVVPVSFHQLPS